MAKLFIFALIMVLFIIHILFLSIGFYGNCKETKTQECKICIDNGEQYPCSCEYIQKCEYNIAMFLIPIFMIILCLLNLLND